MSESNGGTSSNMKLGLCLSGGGFRAALFHIGALAALAEHGLLHQVEVLSTVSGGSIVGAYYYLKVKQLLEGRRSGCPNPQPEHYLDIVREIQDEFPQAVQENIRMRLFLNPYKTALMLLDEDYSRSDRLSELLDAYLYDRLALTNGLRLQDIHIRPVGGEAFLGANRKLSVERFNASPQQPCKIPVLTINATCLNTGHPFHFTGSWVGEPNRIEYSNEQNSTVVLPQLRFDGTYLNNPSHPISETQLRKLQQIKLSSAVAASAAVPGVFPPLPIHDLYRNSRGDEIVVELADGGVFDNQGRDALFNARCTHVVISDACGQLEDERLLMTDLLSTAQRANDVMMERIRGGGYFNLWFRGQACRNLSPSSVEGQNFVRNYCFIGLDTFMHLREEAPNTPPTPGLPGPGNRPGGLIYRISGVRTDLDAFSDLEADALMYHGYTLTHTKLMSTGMSRGVAYKAAKPWRFLSIAEELAGTASLDRLRRHLEVGKNQFFKPFRLAPIASWAWLVFLLSPLVLYLTLWVYEHWSQKLVLPQPDLTWEELARNVALAIIVLLPISPKIRGLFKTVPWLRIVKENPATNTLASVLALVVTVIALLLSVVIFVVLHVYDGVFLRAGQYRK
jgi:predicted acylesterase/phospholipase RssA